MILVEELFSLAPKKYRAVSVRTNDPVTPYKIKLERIKQHADLSYINEALDNSASPSSLSLSSKATPKYVDSRQITAPPIPTYGNTMQFTDLLSEDISLATVERYLNDDPDLCKTQADLEQLQPTTGGTTLQHSIQDVTDMATQLTPATSVSSLYDPALYGEPETQDSIIGKAINMLEKDRRRKETHNKIEKRRRININSRIQELATLLPNFQGNSNRMNKGDILGEAVLLIKKLKDEQDQIRDLLKRQKDLELLNKEMHERLKGMEERNTKKDSSTNVDRCYRPEVLVHMDIGPTFT